jgi:hypothetical protein
MGRLVPPSTGLEKMESLQNVVSTDEPKEA